MKTLDQIEGRIPISSVPFTISASGSYYLTKNLPVDTGDAITINADNVTLDLNGYTLSSTATPAIGAGILLSNGVKNIAIENGHIRGTTTYSAGSFTEGGFISGIVSSGVDPIEARVRNISVSGVALSGISLPGGSGLVKDCVVDTVQDRGIQAGVVEGCIARRCGGTAINSLVAKDCSGESVRNGHGVFASTAATNCEGRSTSGTGLHAGLASNCSGISDTGTGLTGTNATNCNGTSLAPNSASDRGINITATASFCRGSRPAGGLAIFANIAIGCSAVGGGTVTAAGGKFLGTP